MAPLKNRGAATTNGKPSQIGNTSHMLWKIDELIAYVSQFFTLKKGDVLFTGTPEGVGKVTENEVLTGTINGVESFRITVK